MGAQVRLVVVGMPECSAAIRTDKLLLVEVNRHVIVEDLLPGERHLAHVTLLFGPGMDRLEVSQQAGVGREVA